MAAAHVYRQLAAHLGCPAAVELLNEEHLAADARAVQRILPVEPAAPGGSDEIKHGFFRSRGKIAGPRSVRSGGNEGFKYARRHDLFSHPWIIGVPPKALFALSGGTGETFKVKPSEAINHILTPG
jgi:hypothetical protein